MDTQRKSLLDPCDDLEFSADLPKSNNHLKSSKLPECGLTSYSTQVLLDKSSWSNSQYHTRVEWKRHIHRKVQGLEQGAERIWIQIPDVAYRGWRKGICWNISPQLSEKTLHQWLEKNQSS
ncbi:hypothetical protein PoB_005095500 [Plakobranchus ocellatus]|uniref:Uncharacterized protein n=1 Tax=Plakobranchus ocellatus TaxID=259542 RepID=A0AAV4BZ71_9GAST|nr:hypothetical protein PoB_005095500 [Plakobranchus ocellatus]